MKKYLVIIALRNEPAKVIYDYDTKEEAAAQAAKTATSATYGCAVYTAVAEERWKAVAAAEKV